MSATKTRRRCRMRRSLTLGERINVIKQHERAKSMRELSQMFRCSISQIKNILHRKNEYLEEYETNGNLARTKRRQSARFLTLGVILCEWLYRCKHNGEWITDKQIISMAKQTCGKLNMTEIRPGNNWLFRMRDKFKMSEIELRAFYEKDPEKMKSLNMDDIIQDLKKSCPPITGNQSTLTFPYELTRLYLKDVKNEAGDLSKVRMKNCLEEMKRDKYFQGDNVWEKNEADNEIEISEESKMTFSEHSDKSEYSSESCKSEQPKTPPATKIIEDIKPVIQEMCIKEKVLTYGIRSYKEAFNILGPLEHFALGQEDVRAVGLINQLENHFEEQMKNHTNKK